MSGDLERRVVRLEQSHDKLEESIASLDKTIALLNQAVETMAKNEEKKKAMLDKGILFVIGSFVSAFVAWIVGGGMNQ